MLLQCLVEFNSIRVTCIHFRAWSFKVMVFTVFHKVLKGSIDLLFALQSIPSRYSLNPPMLVARKREGERGDLRIGGAEANKECALFLHGQSRC